MRSNKTIKKHWCLWEGYCEYCNPDNGHCMYEKECEYQKVDPVLQLLRSTALFIGGNS